MNPWHGGSSVVRWASGSGGTMVGWGTFFNRQSRGLLDGSESDTMPLRISLRWAQGWTWLKMRRPWWGALYGGLKTGVTMRVWTNGRDVRQLGRRSLRGHLGDHGGWDDAALGRRCSVHSETLWWQWRKPTAHDTWRCSTAAEEEGGRWRMVSSTVMAWGEQSLLVRRRCSQTHKHGGLVGRRAPGRGADDREALGRWRWGKLFRCQGAMLSSG
jgi:hypothetical protein